MGPMIYQETPFYLKNFYSHQSDGIIYINR